MKNKIPFKGILLGGLLLPLSFLFAQAAGAATSVPTVISPKADQQIAPDAPITITGLAQNDSSVFVFVDGKLAGGVKVKNHLSGTASFLLRIKQSYSVGTYSIHVRAIRGGVASDYSQPFNVTIPTKWPRRVDGVVVEAAKANAIPVAVMIENLASVRPQRGLASAAVVYEALAEGGVPRFLAIFVREDMLRVGPVRSARPYYVDWAKEYQGALLHAGGSRDALNEFGRVRLRSVDALVNKTARYFFRVGKQNSTHNLFTSKERLAAVKRDFGLAQTKATFPSWLFKDEISLAQRQNEKRQLIVDFRSGSQYIVAYKYERSSNSYLRFNGGKPHLDANYPKATQIRAKNVVVQLIEKERVLDKQKHLGLQITGTGKGWLLQDGKLTQITWKKQKPDSRTIFYLLNGKEVSFNRGSIWVEVVPKDRPVLYR